MRTLAISDHLGERRLDSWQTSSLDGILISSIGLLMPLQESPEDSKSYEENHVHQVYQQIAPHFSSTRYKPWPIVERFLRGLPDGSIGLDIGCGNGKYLGINPNIFIVASDRSENLVKIACQHAPHDAIVADSLSLPHPRLAFDFAISIAVIHHLSTPARRVQGVAAVLEALRPSVLGNDGGKALIYVWALEQKHSRRGWDKGDKQDVMVPWVMKQRASGHENGKEDTKTFSRYYHLYRSGELEQDVLHAGGCVLEAGYEKDNWWAIVMPKPAS